MSDTELHFVPSRVEGLPEVTAVTVFPDRIELNSGGRIVTRRFADIARWPRPRIFWKALYHSGFKPRWLAVADRDWFQDPADMYFEFYTDPRIRVCMPRDESKDDYGSSYFVRIQNVIRRGGFQTYDVG